MTGRLDYLPDDHEQIDTHHSLEGRLGVEPAHICPAGRGELERCSLDLPCGRVDVSIKEEEGERELNNSITLITQRAIK